MDLFVPAIPAVPSLRLTVGIVKGQSFHKVTEFYIGVIQKILRTAPLVNFWLLRHQVGLLGQMKQGMRC